MEKDIHPEYVEARVTCTCGSSSVTHSTLTSGEMRVDVCSAYHPFCTGEQKILNTVGRVNCFEARYAEHSAVKKAAAEKKATEAKKAAGETAMVE